MGDKSQTVQQKADPWSEAQPYLSAALQQGQTLRDTGGFRVNPYLGGFGGASRQSQNMILDRAGGGAPLTEEAGGYLTQAMQGNPVALEGAKSRALDSAIPAAVSQFAGAGMPNSTLAMDTVGQAAVDAVAPYEYGAMENAQDRALKASGMAPMMDAAGYMPAEMIGRVGGMRDQLAERQHMALQQAPIDEYNRYLTAMMGLGGMGGTQQTKQPGPGPLATIGSAGLGGLGMYGALAANPATAPFAAIGGIGAGLLGLL